MRIVHALTAGCVLCIISGANASDPTITLNGVCPGRITLSWEGATPDGHMGIAFALETGAYIIPTPCGGTQRAAVPSGWAGQTRFLQAVDLNDCRVSNLIEFTFPN